MSKVELELEDVAAVVVHLIHLEGVERKAKRHDLAQRTHNIAAKLADLSGARSIREYVADEHARMPGVAVQTAMASGGVDWCEAALEEMAAGIEARADTALFAVSENEVMETLRQLYSVRRGLNRQGNVTEGVEIDQLIQQVASILNGATLIVRLNGVGA